MRNKGKTLLNEKKISITIDFEQMIM